MGNRINVLKRVCFHFIVDDDQIFEVSDFLLAYLIAASKVIIV